MNVLHALPTLLPLADDGTWFNNRYIQMEFWPKALETLNMTLSATAITVLLGLPLGLALVATGPRGLAPNRLVNKTLSVLVDIGRSVPFILLMVMVAPLTFLLVGSRITWQSAVVPLTLSAVPFFARLVETSIGSVGSGKVEAAQMMGASKRNIMFVVLVREALPQLISNVTVLLVAIIGYTAMAGAIGSGGLGQLAINNGYYRNKFDVVTICVIGIMLMVILFQTIGDMLSRLVDHRRR